MSERAVAQVTIKNRLGLHARPAMEFVDTASAFAAKISVKRRDQVVDGKSIMQMLMLAATQGTELELVAEGADAPKAIEKLVKLIDARFGEE